MATTLKLLVGTLLIAISTALDAKLIDVKCNETLPVTIVNDTLKIVCPDSGADVERCSFHGDTAYLTGDFLYNGVENVGLTDSTAYMTANIVFVSLEYLLFKNQEINLCNDEWITPASDANADSCVADGTYGFSIPYTLPDYEDKSSWLATGWQGTGFVKMFSDSSSSDEMMIGYCTFKLSTMVTNKGDGSFTPPTAAMTAGIIAGVIALSVLLCLYCTCCRGSKKVVSTNASDAGSKHGSTASFTKMEDGGSKQASTASFTKMEDDGTLDTSKSGTIESKKEKKRRRFFFPPRCNSPV